ncbi:RNA polymerase sigma factor [uncultured Maribacter sp.]|uniref:RNA polymerase sigma factor n=1 Tax=uncultured Maribacter sp. TaxID=431308 RepID=UPI002611946E|nr:RNA polymerase sigma factor [uncultured Maribacter sp.]
MTFLRKLCLIIISNQFNTKLAANDPYKDVSDEELVKKIVAKKDSMLFGVLYDRYAKLVYNKCYGFAKSQDEANDLTQDVFLMLFVKLSTFKGKSKFSTWLYSFTYNFCVNYVNRDKGRKISDNASDINENENIIPVEVTDESLYDLQVAKLKKAMELIDPEDKSLLLLKYQDGVSIKELEGLLNIGSSAVKMRLKRAKAKIIEIYNTLP